MGASTWAGDIISNNLLYMKKTGVTPKRWDKVAVSEMQVSLKLLEKQNF